MASSLHYLTVQDILWINLQVTKKVHHFSYAKLEEAVYYQYAYGASNSLIPQSGRFLSGFLRMHPLEVGNEATGFVATLAFLRANGKSVSIDDRSAAEWFQKASESRLQAKEAIEKVVLTMNEHHHEDVRTAISEVLDTFPQTIAGLLGLAKAVA